MEFFGDEIDRITQIDTLTGEILCELEHIAIFPASHYVVPMDTILKATQEIEKDMQERVRYFKSEGKLLEAQRIEERTTFDIEMLRGDRRMLRYRKLFPISLRAGAGTASIHAD